jgi:hypothetical protein
MVTAGLVLTVIGEGAALLAIAYTPNVIEAILVVSAMGTLALLLVVPFTRLMTKEFHGSSTNSSKTQRAAGRLFAVLCGVATGGVALTGIIIAILHH